jgi:hypothetical protein
MLVIKQAPLVMMYSDSAEYIAAAKQILSGNFAPHIDRTPGYPALIAIVFALTQSERLGYVVIAQGILLVVAALEVYVLVYILSGRRWVGVVIACLVGGNLYLADWSRVILSETLTVWLLVSIMLCFASYTHRATFSRFAVLALLLVFAVFTRPQTLYLPALLIAILCIRAARERRLIIQLPSALLSLALIYGLVLLYMFGFWLTYGTFGISKVSNVNLLGAVMTLRYRYHMPLDNMDPKYYKLQTDVLTFRGGKPDPWVLSQHTQSTMQTQEHSMARLQRSCCELTLTTWPVERTTHSSRLPVGIRNLPCSLRWAKYQGGSWKVLASSALSTAVCHCCSSPLLLRAGAIQAPSNQ